MIKDLLRDPGLERLAARVHPDGDPDEVVARAAWSVVAEPGDGVAGGLVAGLGARRALFVGMAQAPAPREIEEAVSALGGAGGERMLREARARWQPRADATAVRSALATASEAGVRLLLPGDPEWPTPLDDLGAHAPTVLWVRGDPGRLRGAKLASIVGARASSSYGDQTTGEIAGDLAGGGVVIVSGGAYGIDGAAHRAALSAGGGTVAVLAGGVDRPYPMGHHQLFERIAVSGAVVAEVPCGTAPTKWRFLSRNRLIAALGDATVVVEAGIRSGSLNTAGHAAAIGRPLGAVPGPVSSPASAGCHRLLREYDARCVTSASEVRELWGDSSGVDVRSAPPRDAASIRVLDALSSRTGLDVHEIARRAGMSQAEVRSVLGMLELDEAVRRMQSGWVRCAQTRR
ncbi:DNA-processing protein DprA [Microbacterium sp. NPDC055903]